MLGLFQGTPLGQSNVEKSKQPRRKQHGGGGGGVAATVAASEMSPAAGGAKRGLSSFNAAEAEEVLGLRRLLVKIVGARDLPDKVGSRRSCSAEVRLLNEILYYVVRI